MKSISIFCPAKETFLKFYTLIYKHLNELSLPLSLPTITIHTCGDVYSQWMRYFITAIPSAPHPFSHFLKCFTLPSIHFDTEGINTQ